MTKIYRTLRVPTVALEYVDDNLLGGAKPVFHLKGWNRTFSQNQGVNQENLLQVKSNQ
jgi:hypothetical protein